MKLGILRRQRQFFSIPRQSSSLRSELRVHRPIFG
ncbi:hypothetical protein E2C01_024071 [Portunus trituberculatus]|uniref:Uncharacterized protein n=1 Tax=Portunus trituberculatus TaxID=210409 RepID=A0A5B7E9P6_PORTR|nr:hypothetical protein [Portunus trituberculatus]